MVAKLVFQYFSLLQASDAGAAADVAQLDTQAP
jgi:hypothetical protein